MKHVRRIVAVLVGAVLVSSIAGSSSVAGADSSVPTAPSVRLYAPHTLLVAFDAGVPTLLRNAVHAANGATVANNLGFQDVDVVTLPNGVDPLTAAGAYNANPLVDFAEPNYVFTATGTPNDASFSTMYGLDKIDAPEGWTAAYGPTSFPSTGGIRVGVVDTGVDKTQADLGAKV